MRVVVTSLLGLSLFSSMAWAVEPVAAPHPAPTASTTTTATPVSGNGPAKTAAPVNNTALNGASVEGKPLTAEQLAKNKALHEAKVKALVKDQASRLTQLEKANLDALAQNQELQLKNDSLGVQVQVLQSERSAQMFLYGATTLAVGVLLGFLIASYVYTKRRRQW